MMTAHAQAAVAKKVSSRWSGRGMNRLLWTIQAIVAALFLFAGGMKLVLPIEAMTKEMILPGWFLRFIGVAEILGAIGLILPWLLNIKRVLTPLAACGLIMIMSGATVITFQTGGLRAAVTPFIVGTLLSLVAGGRWNVLRDEPAQNQTNDLNSVAGTL